MSIIIIHIIIIKMENIVPLPIELTNLILEFSGYHKLRNGRYMRQLAEPELFDIAIKIQRMPKIIHGYVKIKMPTTITTTTNKLETTIILFYNSPSIYKKSTRL